MAITNYQELQSAVADWLDRSDLSARIPDFIRLGEDALFSDLRCPGNEQWAHYDETDFDNSQYIEIPGDYIEAKNVLYNGLPLQFISDQRYFALRHENFTGGIPGYYTRVKDLLYFYPPADENASVELIYYQTQGPLTNPNDTTRTLQFAPGLYLFSALLQAQAYLIGDARLPVWGDQYAVQLAKVNEQALDSDFAGSTIVMTGVYGD